MKREKSTEQRLRCPVLFSMWAGGAPPEVWRWSLRPRGLGAGRRKCEDFAPRDGGTRASGEMGAKKRSRRGRERAKSGGGNVKILLPETEAQGLAGSGEQREEAAGGACGLNSAAGM